MPRHLLPLVAGTAALAVGITAAVVGVQFAAPQVVGVDRPTVEAPYLAPVDGSMALADLVTADGDSLVSPVVGTDTVVDPDAAVAEGELAPDVESLVADLDTADDPGAVLDELELGAPEGTPASGDPCADPEAPSGESCPDGVPGTILLTGGDAPERPPFTLAGGGLSLHDCPAPAELGELSFWVASNAPATITVRITQADGTERTQRIVSSEAQDDAWHTALLTGDRGALWIENCVFVTGLTPGLNAIIRMDGVDDLGRSYGRETWATMPDGLRRPPTLIHALGLSQVYVQAPRTDTERVVTTVVTGTAENPPSCSYTSTAGVRDPIRSTEVAVTPAELEGRGYRPEYTTRVSATFAVPPSTPIMVCVGWFPASGGSAFDHDRPTRVSELPFVTPRLSVPAVTVDDVRLDRELAAGAVRMRAITEDGVLCGTLGLPETAGDDADDSRGGTLCDIGRLLGWDRADGALQISTEVESGGRVVTSRALIDARLTECAPAGDCAGRPRYFDIPLSLTERPRGLCSGDCPVPRSESAGVVRLKVVSTPTAERGGEAGWQIGTWYEGATRVTRDPLPRLDTTERVVLGAVDPATRTQSVSVRIRADRLVTARVELVPVDAALDAGCMRPGDVRVVEFAAAEQRAAFDGLCLGAGYTIRATLDDGDGGVVSYGEITDTDRRWLSGFGTDGEPVFVATERAVVTFDDPARVAKISGLELTHNGTEVRIPMPAPEQRCVVGTASTSSLERVRTSVGEQLRVRFRMSLSEGSDPATPAPASRGWTRCDVGSALGWVEFTAVVGYDELMAGTRVTMHDPDTEVSVTVELRGEPAS